MVYLKVTNNFYNDSC